MNGFTTVVFDLDGTLLDTLDDLHLTLNQALSRSHLPQCTYEQVRARVGNGIRRLVERSVPSNADPAIVQTVFDTFNEVYALHCRDHTHPYPGIHEMLTQLHNEGCLMAVVSNKTDYAVQELVDAYFPHTFDAVLGVRADMRRKPARDMVDAALTQLAATSSRNTEAAVYVGDSEVDIATARAAQLPCINVTWGFRTVSQLKDAGATTYAATPDELLACIHVGASTE